MKMMTDLKRAANITVQRRNIPVLAFESEKAGSCASSSSDCSTVEVDQVAPTMYKEASELASKKNAEMAKLGS